MLTFSSSFSTAAFSLSDLSNCACFSAPSWEKKYLAAHSWHLLEESLSNLMFPSSEKVPDLLLRAMLSTLRDSTQCHAINIPHR